MASLLEVEGVREIRRALQQTAEGAAGLKDAHLAAAEIVADAARPLMRRRTGRMASRLKATGAVGAGYVKVTGGQVYHIVQEYGSRRGVRPTKALATAARSTQAAVVDKFHDEILALARKNNLEIGG